MKIENKTEIKNNLETQLGRAANNDEIINMSNDALLLAKFLIKKVEDLEDRIIILEEVLLKIK